MYRIIIEKIQKADVLLLHQLVCLLYKIWNDFSSPSTLQAFYTYN